VIAAVAMGLILLGFRTFEIDTDSAGDAIGSAIAAVTLFALVGMCFAKQRMLHGAVGLFVFPIAAYAAARLGKPGSPWAKRFYGERNPRKQAKAEERFAAGRRTERFKERFRDTIGGETGEAYEAKLAQHTGRRTPRRRSANEPSAPRREGPTGSGASRPRGEQRSRSRPRHRTARLGAARRPFKPGFGRPRDRARTSPGFGRGRFSPPRPALGPPRQPSLTPSMLPPPSA
jgi:hypothetical protein